MSPTPKSPSPNPSKAKSSRGSITLVLDPDEAGQRAAESSGRALLELLSTWGLITILNEPYAYALAYIQREIDDLGDQIKGREALGLPTDQTEYYRSLAWDYMEDLRRKNKPSVFSRATSPEELNAAVLAQDRPLTDDEKKGRIDFEKIKRDNPIEVFVGQFADLRPAGNKFRTACPLPDHEDDTPSFWVYPETRSWYCFGCNRGGDVIDFAKLKGIETW